MNVEQARPDIFDYLNRIDAAAQIVARVTARPDARGLRPIKGFEKFVFRVIKIITRPVIVDGDVDFVLFGQFVEQGQGFRFGVSRQRFNAHCFAKLKFFAGVGLVRAEIHDAVCGQLDMLAAFSLSL